MQSDDFPLSRAKGATFKARKLTWFSVIDPSLSLSQAFQAGAAPVQFTIIMVADLAIVVHCNI